PSTTLFRSRGVRDARRAQVRLGLRGDLTRVAAVGLVRVRVDDVEVEDERLLLREGVHERRRRVRDELHVGLVDGLEPTDRRAVEHLTVGEEGLVDARGGDGEVLHLAGQVTEPDVDVPNVLTLDEGQDFLWLAEHPLLLGWWTTPTG